MLKDCSSTERLPESLRNRSKGESSWFGLVCLLFSPFYQPQFYFNPPWLEVDSVGKGAAVG